MLGVVAVGDVTDLPEQEDEFDTDSESDADNDTDITFSRFGRTKLSGQSGLFRYNMIKCFWPGWSDMSVIFVDHYTL